MKKRIVKLLGLVAGAMFLLLMAVLIPREPRYDGDTLSYWMAHWHRGINGALVDPSAQAAVREIGTNGLRYYVAWMSKPVRWSTDTDHQTWALNAFEVLGPVAKPAIPALIGMLGNGGNQPALALAYIGKDSIPALTNFLTTNVFSKVPRRHKRIPPWMAEQNAMYALVYMGTNAEAAVPTLIWDLQGGKRRSPADAAATLAVIGHNRPDLVVPVLVQALTNATGNSRASAAEALGTFESQAKVAAPSLRLVCLDQDASVRTHASAALRRIEPNEANALLPLVQNLTNRTVQVREQALWVLLSLGTNGLDALPVLIEASLHDPVPEVRTTAMRCIIGMGRFSDEVLAGLVDNLSHPNESVREAAVGAVASFAGHSQPAFNALLKASRNQRGAVRTQARNHVSMVGNQNPSLLVSSFDNSDPEIRSCAFQVLSVDVGLEVNAAVSALLKAVRDDDFRVREAATNALKRIAPKP